MKKQWGGRLSTTDGEGQSCNDSYLMKMMLPFVPSMGEAGRGDAMKKALI